MSFVYILASKPFGTLYTGSTANLVRRVWEHRIKAVPGFSAKYGIDRLVWYEQHESLETAMLREKRIKEWKMMLEADGWVPAFAGTAVRRQCAR
jgi:putative endonuclease